MFMSMDTSDRRPKLKVSEQIERLASRSVRFDVISREDAKEALCKTNNYFKLTAYRKSFDLDDDGKYIDLDFAYLKDLSKIDMYLRYCLLEMSLDIEHFGKAKFMDWEIISPQCEPHVKNIKDVQERKATYLDTAELLYGQRG